MKLPKKSKLFKNIVRNEDVRGSIKSIVDYKISNVSIITSNSNSIRSNHYHIKDFHFMYVLEGKIDYFFKGIDDDNDNMSYLEVNIGDTIFTPKMEVHCTFFQLKQNLLSLAIIQEIKKLMKKILLELIL